MQALRVGVCGHFALRSATVASLPNSRMSRLLRILVHQCLLWWSYDAVPNVNITRKLALGCFGNSSASWLTRGRNLLGKRPLLRLTGPDSAIFSISFDRDRSSETQLESETACISTPLIRMDSTTSDDHFLLLGFYRKSSAVGTPRTKHGLGA